jgi:hypothetical protein
MFALIKQFITDNARTLGQQLSKFEQNVASALSALADGMIAQPTQVRFTPQTSPAQALTTNQIGLCDTTTGNVSFVLATPSDGKPGFAWILKRGAANAVTVKPSGIANSASRLINGATSKAYAAGAVGLFSVYYDGANWWAA